jgi:sulfatase maturation enzyme AslB (radical SAM superfamily)
MQLTNKEVRIENSSICNAACTICPREKMTRKKCTMPNGHFDYLVDQAKELGADTISIFGYGEPLLDQGVVNKVAYCNRKGLKTFITTNGSLLNTNMATWLLEAGLDKIRLSVHGMFDDYERVHIGLKFYPVMRNIQNFIAKNNTRFGHQCTTALSVIPMGGESVEYIREVWEDAFDELEIWKPHNWTDGRHYRYATKERKKTCGRPSKGPIQINADGKMMVCCFDYDAKMTVGDTYKNSIEEIVKGHDFWRIRKYHEYGLLSKLPCSTCDQLFVGDNPLLYSNVDETCSTGKTSSTKFSLE